MRILDRGTIFDATAAPPERRFCTVPSLVRLENGRLVAALRAGSSKDAADEDTPVLVSDDEAAAWRLTFPGFGDLPPGRGRIRAASLTPLGGNRLVACLTWVDRSDPALPLFDPQTEGILPTRTLLAVSEDAGESWAVLGEVPLAPHKGYAITGAILPLRDGRMALPYEAWKEWGTRLPEGTTPRCASPARVACAQRRSRRPGPASGRSWPSSRITPRARSSIGTSA